MVSRLKKFDLFLNKNMGDYMLHCYFCNGIHKWQLMEDQKIMLVYRTFILVKKKKKKVQNAPFELNNIPYFSSSTHFMQTPSSLTLSHSVTRLSLSLRSCLPASVSALRLPCGCETLSQTATQSLQTPKFSSLSILWVVFNL